MKKVLTDSNEVLELKNSDVRPEGSKAILEYTHEDTGYCKLVFKYGKQVFVFQEGVYMYASPDEEPEHKLNHTKVIIDLETPYSRLEKQAYEVAKKDGVLLWQALRLEEPQEDDTPDNSPLYSDDLTIAEYNARTTAGGGWKPEEFEQWQVRQEQAPFMPIHDGFKLMGVVYWRNDYGVEFTSRIVAFAEDGLHLAPLDVGGECYWTVKNINRYKIRKATVNDIIKTCLQYDFDTEKTDNLNDRPLHARGLDFKTVLTNGTDKALMQCGDKFLRYENNTVNYYTVSWYAVDTYIKAYKML